MPNTDTVLILNPEFDEATSFTHYWANQVITVAQQLGLNVIALDKGNARLIQFQSSIAGQDPLFVYGNGHGIEQVYTAQNQEDILWVPSTFSGHTHTDTNINLVQNRIVYLLSCLTGAELGPAIGDQPDTYYVGYKEDFVFNGFTPGDEYSQPFGQCSNAIATRLLNGGTIEEAYDEGIKQFNHWIDVWEQSNDPSASFIISSLIHDRDALVMFPGMPPPPPPRTSIFPAFLSSGYATLLCTALL